MIRIHMAFMHLVFYDFENDQIQKRILFMNFIFI